MLTYFTPSDPWLRLRVRQAARSLQQAMLSARESALMIMLLASSVALSLIACFSVPLLYAATLPWEQALGVWLAFLLLQLSPCWLLRSHLLPADLMQCARRWPLPAAAWWRAHLLLAGAGALLWLALSMLSGALLAWYAPPWLGPSWPRGVLLLVSNLLAAWLLAAALLQARWRNYLRAPAYARPALLSPARLQQLPLRMRLLYLLWWLPSWRLAGRPALLLGGFWLLGVAALVLWRSGVAPQLAALPCVLASAAFLLQADRSLQFVRQQQARLQAHLQRWPQAAPGLALSAALLSLTPAACLWLGAAYWLPAQGASVTWLAAGALSPLLSAWLQPEARGRVALLLLSLCLMGVSGAEIAAH
ncbi:hypothetical protein V8J88_22575 [Massilia sp. W12]|uniref:hypothetical protein n=1 Tax=Massilia sp. W12 TaxID=3126507 RepID=UPI0030D0D329